MGVGLESTIAFKLSNAISEFSVWAAIKCDLGALCLKYQMLSRILSFQIRSGRGEGGQKGHPSERAPPLSPADPHAENPRDRESGVKIPLPCNPEAETALQPLIWHSEGLSFQVNHFQKLFFTDTGIAFRDLPQAFLWRNKVPGVFAPIGRARTAPSEAALRSCANRQLPQRPNLCFPGEYIVPWRSSARARARWQEPGSQP